MTKQKSRNGEKAYQTTIDNYQDAENNDFIERMESEPRFGMIKNKITTLNLKTNQEISKDNDYV